MLFVRFRESYRLLENITDENVESFPIRKMKRIFSACGQWRQSKINLYHSQTCVLQYLIVLPSISLLSLWPMYCNTSGLPVLHNLPEFAQICVHWVGDAIQPSHPLLLSPQHLIALLLTIGNKIFFFFFFALSSVQFSCSVMFDSLWPHGLQHIRHPCPSPIHRVYKKLMSIELVMASNHLILCQPLLLLPSIFPSIRVFSNESVLHIRRSKYWSFSFSISPSNE